MSKSPITVEELNEHLAEHIQFLKASAQLFDSGILAEAKRIAVSLRVIFHSTSNSHSIIEQLGKQNDLFWDTAIDHNPRNVLSHHGLISLRITYTETGSFATYKAFLKDLPGFEGKLVPFNTWWNKIVLVDSKKNNFSRQSLILKAANQDGGAHVDPKLDDVYRALKNGSLGWTLVNEQGGSVITDPQAHSIRQIAFEVLQTLDKEH